jgi:hypothetical protein
MRGTVSQPITKGRVPLLRLCEIDAGHSLCYEVSAVLSRTVISVIVAMMLPVAAMPLSARSCILSNVASEKACKPGCCANKKCCETSEKNRATPSQPLAKSAGEQQNIVASPSAIAVVEVDQAPSAKSFSYLKADCSSHFPATLAFICIRLI